MVHILSYRIAFCNIYIYMAAGGDEGSLANEPTVLDKEGTLYLRSVLEFITLTLGSV